MESISRNLRRAQAWIDARSGGLLSILDLMVRGLAEVRAAEAAASMAYYALFSLFPLLLTLIAAGSYVLERNAVQEQVVAAITRAVPVSQSLIEENVQRVLDLRGTVGVVGLIGLTWSATGFFSSLINNINRAWPNARARGFVRLRLLALGMVLGLVVLLLVASVASSVIDFVVHFNLPLWGGVSLADSPAGEWIPRLIPGSLMFLTLTGLYIGVPRVRVGLRPAAWGALLATVGWQLSAAGFTRYLSSDLARFHLVYGSLGAVVALMLWSYIGSLVLLVGAHLSAAVDRYGRSGGSGNAGDRLAP